MATVTPFLLSIVIKLFLSHTILEQEIYPICKSLLLSFDSFLSSLIMEFCKDKYLEENSRKDKK